MKNTSRRVVIKIATIKAFMGIYLYSYFIILYM